MNSEKVFLVGVHRYCFRAGEKAEIIGFEYIQPSPDLDYRLAYKVKYEDGCIDWIALSEVQADNVELLPALHVELGLIPVISK